MLFVNTYEKNVKTNYGRSGKMFIEDSSDLRYNYYIYSFGGKVMSVTMEFFDGINFDIAKQKYYNANKVDARMQEIKAAFAELIEENNELRRQLDDVGLSKERVAELIMGAQAKADEMIKEANAKAEEIIKNAKLDADGIVVSRRAAEGDKTLGLTPNQLAAIDKLNKQLDDFNVAQATQIFRIKQALMGIALDK